MAKIKPRVKVPKTAEAGEIVTIKSLISHPMESGQRKDKKTGETIPMNIVNYFKATFNGETVFEVDIDPAVSTNPYIEFTLKVAESGTVGFLWVTDNDGEFEAEKKITVK
jgi:sulfur-oxidizing protein SoxZ